MILRIGQKASHKDIEDIAYYLLSLYEINDTDVNYDELDIGQVLLSTMINYVYRVEGR